MDTVRLEDYIKEAQINYEQNINLKKRTDYAQARKKYKVDDYTILYTAFYGRGLSCNPYAIFNYLRNNKEYEKYKHVWVLDSLKEHKREIAEYKRDKRVIFVEFESDEYFKYLSEAKYLINNSTEMSYFVKKPEQIMINTWHGIPLKTMGYDIPGGGMTIGNTMRNFLMDDYLISPDEFMTGIYRDAYKMNNIYEGTVLEAGYPRCDTLFNTDKAKFVKKVKKYGLKINMKKKIILYAPTWKGTDFNSPEIDISKEMEFIEELYKYVDRRQYQILFKPHQVVYNNLKKTGNLPKDCVPAIVDANEILAVSDILISDYSSIFFDFLVTGRPILFYIPDLEKYQEERGLYLGVDLLPGPATDSASDVGSWLKQLDENIEKYKELFNYKNYTDAVEKFVPYEDGKACERMAEAVFKGNHKYDISLKTDKKKLLIHVDTLKTNGITSAVLNMMNYIDYDKYDVTLMAVVPKNENEVWNKINVNVRALARIGTLTATIEEMARKEYCHRNNIIGLDGEAAFPEELFSLEYKRSFGEAKFDYILNYSGYSGYWANIYATEKNARHIMWIHNDLKAELENRVVNGVHLFENMLPQIFKHYHNVDKIVGCSKSTMLINREKLGESDTFDKFTWMHNMMDFQKVYDNMDTADLMEIDGKKYIITGKEEYFTSGTVKISYIPVPSEENINFVTVGRISPEKNHRNLIEAFEKLLADEPRARLYILGNGPLAEEIRKLIISKNLVDKVMLTGNVPNPFYIVKRCQCFILPSFHEGMPMVLLEARTIGIPIIVSEFSTVADSLHPNGQLVIQTDVDSIYSGMKAYLNGEVPNEYKFNPEEYNRKCMEEFENILNS